MIKVITNCDPSQGETTMNCNPNLVHVYIPVHDPEWFDFRTVGIKGVYESGFGASEVSKVMQVEPEHYRPVLPELIEHKAGISVPQRRITEAMLSGIFAEPTILERWEYWDNSDYGYLDRYLCNEKMREFDRVNAYIYNKRFPWLFVSLDAKIRKGCVSLNGEVLTEDCPLECKTIGFQAARSQKYPIPLSYVFQIQQQMLVTETEYAEMAILESGSKFKVIPFVIDPYICEQILEKTRAAWEIVLNLRAMKAEKEKETEMGNWGVVEKLDAEMQSLLPLPGEGDAYKEYHSDSYLKTADKINGGMELFEMARKRNDLATIIGLMEGKKGEYENLFTNKFVKEQCEYIDFGESLGKVRYYKKSNGKNFQLDFKGLKDKPDMELLTEIYNEQFKHLTAYWD